MEDKIIRIPKPTEQPFQQQKVINIDDLKRAEEFSKEEIIGVINLSLNQLIQDRISLEISLRFFRYVRELERNKGKIDEADAKVNEILAKIENFEKRIKIHRQVRSEIEDGRFIV